MGRQWWAVVAPPGGLPCPGRAPPPRASGLTPRRPGPPPVPPCLQYANHGTLGDAVDRGWLRQERTRASPPSLPAVLATALEIAAALQYLHGQK